MAVKGKYASTENANILSDWIRRRGISATRSDYKNMMETQRTDNSTELSMRSLCLALDDCYWIHKEKSDLKWENVNYYDNITPKMLKIRIFPSKSEDNENYDPDFCAGGNLPKGWLHNGKNWLLLKEATPEYKLEPYNEVIASKFMKENKIEHISYSKRKIKEKQVSVCNCRTSNSLEYLPAQFVLEQDTGWKINPYRSFISTCKKHGITDAKQKIDEMIAVDFLISNADRHDCNFGILRNPDTLQWVSLMPLFDHGNSLFLTTYNLSIIKDLDSYCKWRKIGNLKMLNDISYPEWYSGARAKKLLDIIDYAYGNNTEIKISRKDKIISLTKNRLNYFDKYVKTLHTEKPGNQ